MTLDSLPDLDTSGLCLVKTLPTALTCWPYRNMALRDGARTSTRTSSVAKGRMASIHCRPAPPRQTEALSSRTSRSRPWKRRSQAVRERKTSVLRACRVPNLAKRLNVVQRPKTLFEPQRSMTGVAADRPRRRHDLGARAAHSGPGTPQATGVATPTDARSASPTPTRLRRRPWQNRERDRPIDGPRRASSVPPEPSNALFLSLMNNP